EPGYLKRAERVSGEDESKLQREGVCVCVCVCGGLSSGREVARGKITRPATGNEQVKLSTLALPGG
ncbi:unnamed protein product, partial [Musa textilis]